MRFGGHETFTVRSGWLSKGLLRVREDPVPPFDSPEVADALGVGRNMAKSIWHWLQVTDLAHRAGRDGHVALTPLGELVLRHDPFMQYAATWWALHVNLVTQPDAAVAWRWFFNDFARERFDRMACADEFMRGIAREGQRVPSGRTIGRDIACLLQSYATPLPAEPDDPEDATDCPFRQLGLVVQHRDTGYFDRRFGRRPVPPELLGYVLARMTREERHDVVEIRFTDGLVARFGPGRVLVLDADGLAALVDELEDTLGRDQARSYLLGGERMIVVAWDRPTAWLARYYDRVGA